MRTAVRVYTRTREGTDMKNKKIVNIELTAEFKKVRDSMLKQLKDKNIQEEFYINLVKTYMKFWVDVKHLEKDIQERGINITVNGRYGDEIKKNDSLGEKIRVSAQMLRILDSLGLKQKDFLKETPKDDENEDDC